MFILCFKCNQHFQTIKVLVFQLNYITSSNKQDILPSPCFCLSYRQNYRKELIGSGMHSIKNIFADQQIDKKINSLGS